MKMHEYPPLISRAMFYSALWLGGAILLVYLLRGVLAPILLAFILAYAFNPVVRHAESHGISRGVSAALCLGLITVLVLSLIGLILPSLWDELRLIADRAPRYLEEIQQTMIPWLEQTLDLKMPHTFESALETTRDQLNQRASEWAGPAALVLQKVLRSTLSFMMFIVYLILIPVFTYYFLKDMDRILDWVIGMVPLRFQPKVKRLFDQVDVVLAGFFRGQLMVCTLLATLYTVALTLLGVPASFTIGILVGCLNMVPYVGVISGMALSMLFLLLDGASWGMYAGVLAVFGVFIGLDSTFITPRIMGKNLGLAPLAIILAILIFGELFGFLGVLLAVPVSAVAKVVGLRLLALYRECTFYQGEAEEAVESGGPKQAA